MDILTESPGAESPLHVQTFGQLSIMQGEKEVLDVRGLGDNLKKLFSILVSSPDKRVNLEHVQAFFWPEKSAKQGRGNLDTTVKRLNTAIAKTTGLKSASNLLTIKKGQIRIDGIRLDTDSFMQNVEAGLEYVSDNMNWLAVDCFRAAFSLWKGDYIPGIISAKFHNQCIDETLSYSYRACSEKWCDIILAGEKVHDGDLQLLRNALKKNISNTNFVRKMYQIYSCFGFTCEAADFINSYRDLLLEEGVSPVEIEVLMDKMWEQRRTADTNIRL